MIRLQINKCLLNYRINLKSQTDDKNLHYEFNLDEITGGKHTFTTRKFVKYTKYKHTQIAMDKSRTALMNNISRSIVITSVIHKSLSSKI